MFRLPIILIFSVCSFHALSLQAQSGSSSNAQTYVRKIRTTELQNVNEVYYFNGKPYTGTSIDLFEDKSRQQELNWKNGLLHGSKTEYFPGGRVVRTVLNFYEGRRHGAFVFYHENGKVMLEGVYHFDLLDSTVNSYYINGNPKYVHHYDKGVKVGESLTYYKNGQLEQKVSLKNEKPHGTMLTYYEAGNLRMESNFNEGIRDGRFLRYHLTGQLAEESYFRNGLQDSVSKYWDNVFGTLMKEEYYSMGKKSGCWITYNEFGDTLSLYHYQNDLLNGPYKKYYAGTEVEGDRNNGKSAKFDPARSRKIYVHELDEYGTFLDGKLHGEFKTGLYLREGHAEGSYDQGMMVGEWKYFNAEDKLVLHEKYNENGELIYQKPKIKSLRSDR